MPLQFAGDSSIMVADGTMVKLKSTFVSEGTMPVGSTWQMMPIPGWSTEKDGGWVCECEYWFEPPCYEPNPVPSSVFPITEYLSQGMCSGLEFSNMTIYDQLRVPDHLEPGDYVLGFRWDCETSSQIWQSCADITI